MIIRHLKAKAAAARAWPLYVPFVLLIALAILAPLGGPTEDDPTGGANYMAPILALSVVAINILRNWLGLRGAEARWIRLVTSGGLLFSAYFWLAAESEQYPYSTQLIGELGLIAGIAVGTAAFLLLPTLAVWIFTPEPEDK